MKQKKTKFFQAYTKYMVIGGLTGVLFVLGGAILYNEFQDARQATAAFQCNGGDCEYDAKIGLVPQENLGGTNYFPNDDFFVQLNGTGEYLLGEDDEYFRRLTYAPNAVIGSGQEPQITQPISTYVSAGVTSSISMLIPLEGAPAANGDTLRISFRFRAGADPADGSKADHQTDGGWLEQGRFMTQFVSKFSQPLRVEDIGDSSSRISPYTFDSDPEVDCVEEPGVSGSGWCTFSDTVTINAPDIDGSKQGVLWRAGPSLGSNWFVGELQIDDVVVVKDGQSANLIKRPFYNSRFNNPDIANTDVEVFNTVQPADDFYEVTVQSEPNGNGYLNFFSKNYFVIAASPDDPEAKDAFDSYEPWQCGALDNGLQRFYQNIRPDGDCFADSGAGREVQNGTAIFEEEVPSFLSSTSVLMKFSLSGSVCQTFASDIDNGTLTINNFGASRHFIDSDRTRSYTSGDAELPEIQDIDGQNKNNLVTSVNLTLQCDEPDFRIVSQVPNNTSQCFVDSRYSAEPEVSLAIQNPGSFDQVRFSQRATDLNGAAWYNLEGGGGDGIPPGSPVTVGVCDGSTILVQNANLFRQNEQDLNFGYRDMYVQFRKKDQNALSAVLSDNILYGYPFISTFRGDVHSNGSIFGEASSELLAANRFTNSEYLCNPQNGFLNGDYFITAGGDIQSLGENFCEQGDKNFQSNWNKYETNADTNNLLEQIDTSSLLERATHTCTPGARLEFVNGEVQGPGCAPKPGVDVGAQGTIIYAEGDLLIDDIVSDNFETMTLNNSDTVDKSAGVLLYAVGRVVIRDNITYEANDPDTINATRQLASLAVITDSDIQILGGVSNIAGVLVAKGETSKITTSNRGNSNKLSVYGALIARNIEFNRSFLGDY